MLIIEKDIESKLKSRVEHFGGRCIKFTAPAEAGVPDRLVVMPKGKIVFVELKRPSGGEVSDIQTFQINRLLRLGCDVRIIHNYDEIEWLIADLVGRKAYEADSKNYRYVGHKKKERKE